jgi:hypothetical protein
LTPAEVWAISSEFPAKPPQFLKTVNPQDEAFFIEFNNRAELAAGFTSQIEELQNKLISLQPHSVIASSAYQAFA